MPLLSHAADIFLPSIWFRNAYSFSQDRPTGYKIWALPPPDTTVMWMSVVQGKEWQSRVEVGSAHVGLGSLPLCVAEAVLHSGGAKLACVPIELAALACAPPTLRLQANSSSR